MEMPPALSQSPQLNGCESHKMYGQQSTIVLTPSSSQNSSTWAQWTNVFRIMLKGDDDQHYNMEEF